MSKLAISVICSLVICLSLEAHRETGIEIDTAPVSSPSRSVSHSSYSKVYMQIAGGTAAITTAISALTVTGLLIMTFIRGFSRYCCSNNMYLVEPVFYDGEDDKCVGINVKRRPCFDSTQVSKADVYAIPRNRQQNGARMNYLRKHNVTVSDTRWTGYDRKWYSAYEIVGGIAAVSTFVSVVSCLLVSRFDPKGF